MTRESDVAPDVSGVIERLQGIRLETGYGLGRVFRDWMALSVHAFERDDDAYLERLDRYERDGNTETRANAAEAFSEALGELVATTSEADRPVVGDIYEEIGDQADDFGQFFTPWNVCAWKAEMLFSTSDVEEATPEDPVTVADPACGSGRLLVAAAYALHQRDPSTPIVVSGTDKDRTCARMAVVNLVIAGVPGRIRYGNSLTQKMHRTWLVEPNRPGPVVREVDPDADTPREEPSDKDTGRDPVEPGAAGPQEQAGLGRWG